MESTVSVSQNITSVFQADLPQEQTLLLSIQPIGSTESIGIVEAAPSDTQMSNNSNQSEDHVLEPTSPPDPIENSDIVSIDELSSFEPASNEPTLIEHSKYEPSSTP